MPHYGERMTRIRTRDGDDFSLATIFVPVPEPLALPDGAVMPIHETPTWEEQVEAFHRHPDSTFPEKVLLASLCVRQLETTVDPIAEIRTLVEVAHRFIPELATTESGSDDDTSAGASTNVSPRTSTQTVIEVALTSEPLIERGSEPGEASDVDGGDSPYADLGLPTPDPSLETALDVAVDMVRHLQRVHHLFRRTPVTLVTRERLPLLVPCVVRHVRGGEIQASADLVLLVAHTASPPITAPEVLGEDELDQIPDAIELGRRGRVFFSLVEFGREAQVAVHRNGEFRAGVLFAAVAAETFLDDLLAHLLWEEATTPEDAAALFDERPWLVQRVRSAYHSRLGGSWKTEGDGPVAKWFTNVAMARNRILHAGHEPSRAEGTAALTALKGLEDFVARRLCDPARLSRYPRTALSLVGEPQLRSRGQWTKRLGHLSADPTEPHWDSTFGRWLEFENRYRQEAPPVPEPDYSTAVLIYVINPEGQAFWAGHDRKASQAAPTAEPLDIRGELRQMVQGQVDSYLASDPSGPQSIAFIEFDCPEPTGPWCPDYRLVPEGGVMVDRSDLDDAPWSRLRRLDET